METLDEFIARSRKQAKNYGGYSNTRGYVEEPGFENLYVRFGLRYIEQERRETLDLANLSVWEQMRGTGIFTRLVQRIRKDYPETVIYVESVLNPRFATKLLRMGFINIPEHLGINCYYLMPHMEFYATERARNELPQNRGQ